MKKNQATTYKTSNAWYVIFLFALLCPIAKEAEKGLPDLMVFIASLLLSLVSLWYWIKSVLCILRSEFKGGNNLLFNNPDSTVVEELFYTTMGWAIPVGIIFLTWVGDFIEFPETRIFG